MQGSSCRQPRLLHVPDSLRLSWHNTWTGLFSESARPYHARTNPEITHADARSEVLTALPRVQRIDSPGEANGFQRKDSSISEWQTQGRGCAKDLLRFQSLRLSVAALIGGKFRRVRNGLALLPKEAILSADHFGNYQVISGNPPPCSSQRSTVKCT